MSAPKHAPPQRDGGAAPAGPVALPPRASIDRNCDRLSLTRLAIFSPVTVGTLEKRTSTRRTPSSSAKAPSRSRIFIEMSAPAMTLQRLRPFDPGVLSLRVTAAFRRMPAAA